MAYVGMEGTIGSLMSGSFIYEAVTSTFSSKWQFTPSAHPPIKVLTP